MIERKVGQNNSEINDSYNLLNRLIDSGDSVDSMRLNNALEAKQVTQEEYIKLASKLIKKSEWIEEGLAQAGKKLGTQVEELAIDPLTKFFGRALLEPKLSDLIKELNFSEGQRRQSDINAIMVVALDMNGLKFFNDNYNHAVGDQALITLAEHLKKATRRNDILFRSGGDEFTILLPIENKDANFEEIFEKFKYDINTDLSITIEKDGKDFPISVSTGYAVSKRGDFKEAKELLSEADENEREDNKKIKAMNKI